MIVAFGVELLGRFVWLALYVWLFTFTSGVFGCLLLMFRAIWFVSVIVLFVWFASGFWILVTV